MKRPWNTAEKHYTIEDNGLKQKWSGFIWMNPPYGKETGRWLEKIKNRRCLYRYIYVTLF